MEFTVAAVSQIIRTYQTQERIAELNRQNTFRVVQSQQDRVSISDEARRMAELKRPGVQEHPAPPSEG